MTEFSPKKRTYLSARIRRSRRDLEAAGLDFLERRNILAAQPTLNAQIVVKALDGSIGDSPEQEKDKSKKRTAGSGVKEIEPEVRYDPKGVRDPGQVFKLHVTARDLKTGQDNFGWIDPPKAVPKEEQRSNMADAMQWRATRPQIRIRTYDQDPRTGQPIIETEEEIKVKGLGRTLKDTLPGQSLGGRAASGLGLIVDALGKFRCPPGTPAANQFTDEFGTNCFSPVEVLRDTVRGLVNSLRSGRGRSWSLPGRGDSEAEQLRSNIAERRATAGKAGQLIGNTASIEAALIERNTVIQSLMDQYGISAGDELNEDMWSLLEAMTDVDTGDFPDLEWKGLFTGMFGEELWDDNLTMRQNLEKMRATVREDVFSFMGAQTKTGAQAIRDAYRAKDPTAIEMVDNLVGRHESAMRGFLGSTLHEFGDDPRAMSGLKKISFRPYNPDYDDFQSYWGTEGECIPLWEGTGTGMATKLEFNATAVALRPFQEGGLTHEGPDGRPKLVQVDAGGAFSASVTDAEKWAAIADFLTHTEKMEYWHTQYANDLTAAAHGGSLEAFSMHVGYHELAHVKQYQQIAQRVLEAYERDGQFSIYKRDGTGLESLTAHPSEWTNEQFVMAVVSTFQDALPPGQTADFPPMDMVQFEGSMLHLLAGQYYQNMVQDFLQATSGSFAEDITPGQYVSPLDSRGLPIHNTAKAHLNLLFLEGTAELAALKRTGGIAGDELNEVLDWMDADVADVVYGIPEVDVPFKPGSIVPDTDMGEAPWDTPLEPGEVMTPSGIIIPTSAVKKIEAAAARKRQERQLTTEKRKLETARRLRHRTEIHSWGSGGDGEIKTASDGTKYVWIGALSGEGEWQVLIDDLFDPQFLRELESVGPFEALWDGQIVGGAEGGMRSRRELGQFDNGPRVGKFSGETHEEPDGSVWEFRPTLRDRPEKGGFWRDMTDPANRREIAERATRRRQLEAQEGRSMGRLARPGAGSEWENIVRRGDGGMRSTRATLGQGLTPEEINDHAILDDLELELDRLDQAPPTILGRLRQKFGGHKGLEQRKQRHRESIAAVKEALAEGRFVESLDDYMNLSDKEKLKFFHGKPLVVTADQTELAMRIILDNYRLNPEESDSDKLMHVKIVPTDSVTGEEIQSLLHKEFAEALENGIPIAEALENGNDVEAQRLIAQLEATNTPFMLGKEHYDLCKVSVAGSNMFCYDHEGILRNSMPQFSGPVWDFDTEEHQKQYEDALTKLANAAGHVDPSTDEYEDWFKSTDGWTARREAHEEVLDAGGAATKAATLWHDQFDEKARQLRLEGKLSEEEILEEAAKATQFGADTTRELIDRLRADGVRVEGGFGKADLRPGDDLETGTENPIKKALLHLKASQNELIGPKVMKEARKATIKQPDGTYIKNPDHWLFKGFEGSSDPILVTDDGFILDGHHRWAMLVAVASLTGDEDEILGHKNVVVVHMPVNEALGYGVAFADDMGMQRAPAGPDEAAPHPSTLPDVPGTWAKRQAELREQKSSLPESPIEERGMRSSRRMDGVFDEITRVGKFHGETHEEPDGSIWEFRPTPRDRPEQGGNWIDLSDPSMRRHMADRARRRRIEESESGGSMGRLARPGANSEWDDITRGGMRSQRREIELRNMEREIQTAVGRERALETELLQLREDEDGFVITREEFDNSVAEISVEREALKERKRRLQQQHSILKRHRDRGSRTGMRSIRVRKQSDNPGAAETMTVRNADLAEAIPDSAFSAPSGWGSNYATDRTSRALPPIQSRSRALSDHNEKLNDSLDDLMHVPTPESDRYSEDWKYLQGPNGSFLDIDPEVAEFLSNHEKDEVSETIAKAAVQFHRGFDRRPRVLLDSDEFENLLETGSHSRPDIPYGENSVADLRMDYDLRNGFDTNTPASQRPISGHLYHAMDDDQISESLDAIDGPLMERLPDFWDSEGTAPWGDPAAMGGDIDIVLRPEVSDRTHYGTGDAMSRGAIPTPMNSNDADEILAAHTPRWNGGQEDGPFNNTVKMHDLLKAGTTGNYRDLSPDGEHHEAQIAGGIDMDDIEFVRYPVNKLNWRNLKLSDADTGKNDKSAAARLRSAGFSDAEIGYFYDAISEGRVTGLRNVNWLRQHLAAKKAQERFDRLGVGVKFTNPDGIDLMNVDSFMSNLPGAIASTTPADVLRKRIHLEIAERAAELLQDIRKEMKPNRNASAGVLV